MLTQQEPAKIQAELLPTFLILQEARANPENILNRLNLYDAEAFQLDKKVFNFKQEIQEKTMDEYENRQMISFLVASEITKLGENHGKEIAGLLEQITALQTQCEQMKKEHDIDIKTMKKEHAIDLKTHYEQMRKEHAIDLKTHYEQMRKEHAIDMEKMKKENALEIYNLKKENHDIRNTMKEFNSFMEVGKKEKENKSKKLQRKSTLLSIGECCKKIEENIKGRFFPNWINKNDFFVKRDTVKNDILNYIKENMETRKPEQVFQEILGFLPQEIESDIVFIKGKRNEIGHDFSKDELITQINDYLEGEEKERARSIVNYYYKIKN